MDNVVSKKVTFSDIHTIHYVDGDRSCRYGAFWVIDAQRFRHRCAILPPLPVFCVEADENRRVFLLAIEKGADRLLSLKKRMNGVEFYRLLFLALLNSHLFDELKSNIVRHGKLLRSIVDQQAQAIQGLNNLVVSKGFLRPLSPRIFQLLYLEDILDEDNIVAFYNRKFDNERSAYMHRFGKCLLTPLIVWFAIADELDA